MERVWRRLGALGVRNRCGWEVGEFIRNGRKGFGEDLNAVLTGFGARKGALINKSVPILLLQGSASTKINYRDCKVTS